MISHTRRTRVGWIASVGSALVLLAGCGKHADSGDESDSTKPVVNVRMVTVTARPFTATIGAIGTVQPRAGHVASLSALGPSRVARINVSMGQHVAAGAALIDLDSVPFQTAVQGANAALATAQSAYDRATRLADQGIGTRKDAEQAAADLAKARVDAMTARRAQELSVLRSPIPGVITQLSTTLGAAVDANQPLVQIADPAALDVILMVTPDDASKIHVGTSVSLREGDAGGVRLGSASVVDVAGTVDTASRGVAVRVEAPPTGRPLRIGETIYAEIPVASFDHAIMVPSEAVVPDGDAFKVFVVDKSGMAHERDVTLGAKADSMTQVLTGLKVGERIVTYGAYGVEDSATVKEGTGPDVRADSGSHATPAAKSGAAPKGDSSTKAKPPTESLRS